MADNGTYEITWKSKPLGFSIVMDTTGKNAYVSSIQKHENVTKGLKLAAQIIMINGTNVKNMKHQKILEQIKGAKLPMTLKFQPRSFANDPQEQKKKTDAVPQAFLFGGAPKSAKNRVDGVFELTTDKQNGREVWQRKDDEDDPILLWWWPAKTLGVKNMNENLWMISRSSQVGTQNAYACCPEDAKYPSLLKKPWKVFNKDSGKFVECKLSIAAEVDSGSIVPQ